MEVKKLQTAITSLLCFALLALCAPSARATTVVILRTDKEIVMAADSRSMVGDKVENDKNCKINQKGDVLFALSGQTQTPHYDARVIAAQAITQAGSMREAVLRFEDLLMPQMELSLRKLLQSPSLYGSDFTEIFWVEAIFFGIEQGVPTIYQTIIPMAMGSDDQVIFSPKRYECGLDCKIPFLVVSLGRHSYIDKAIRQLKSIPAGEGLVNLARTYLSLEAAHNRDVGGPVDIVRVTNDGVKWIQRKPECK